MSVKLYDVLSESEIRDAKNLEIRNVIKEDLTWMEIKLIGSFLDFLPGTAGPLVAKVVHQLEYRFRSLEREEIKA